MLAVVDVGANIGDLAAALLALPETRVLAIEGNERFFQLLTANSGQWADRLTPVRCLLGERSEVLAATIDAGRGTGRLRPGDDRVVLRTLAEVVDEHPEFREARLVKIDTDGLISQSCAARTVVGRGATRAVLRYDPHFWRPITPDGARLFCELADIGYGPLLVYDNFGWLIWSGSVHDERRLEELDAWLSGRGSSVYSIFAHSPRPTLLCSNTSAHLKCAISPLLRRQKHWPDHGRERDLSPALYVLMRFGMKSRLS